MEKTYFKDVIDEVLSQYKSQQAKATIINKKEIKKEIPDSGNQ